MIVGREELQRQEGTALARYAVRSADSRGRHYPEPEDPYRTAFQRDRDRIIHSSAYRRLGNKTQVFISFEGEHYRTRLTHTEEATQVAVSIARALGANVDLTEAIARAHDLGHAPFGHAGEDVLAAKMAAHGGFGGAVCFFVRRAPAGRARAIARGRQGDARPAPEGERRTARARTGRRW